VERIGSTRTAVYVNVAPIVALITGALWLGERLTVMSFVGAACVIGGVLAVRLAGR
jgi:drug/metabolite transporter (DMT)-like permease